MGGGRGSHTCVALLKQKNYSMDNKDTVARHQGNRPTYMLLRTIGLLNCLTPNGCLCMDNYGRILICHVNQLGISISYLPCTVASVKVSSCFSQAIYGPQKMVKQRIIIFFLYITSYRHAYLMSYCFTANSHFLAGKK